MNRSYSKIRHIQEANILLERRLLREQDVTPTTSSEPVDTTSTVSDCSSLMKKVENTNKDYAGPPEPLTINGTVKITYNGTVSPNYRSVTVYLDGKPYCKIPTKSGAGDCSDKMEQEISDEDYAGGSIEATLAGPVTISDSGPVSPAYQGTVIKDSNGYFCRVPK